MKDYKIAIIGGHGLVAITLLKLLCNSFYKDSDITLFGTKRSEITVGERSFNIAQLDENSVEKFDVAFMCCSNEISAKYTPLFINKGAKVIDNSSYYRLEKNVPLSVCEVNPYDLLMDSSIFCNPNCIAIMLALALKPLHDAYKIEKIITSTYQSVSGAGKDALNQLAKENIGLDCDKVLPNCNSIKKNIYNNIIPVVDEIDSQSNYSKEELKIMNEIRKIFHDENIDIISTCVRIPTRIGHGASLYVTFKDKVDIKYVEKLFKENTYIKYFNDLDYPTFDDVKNTTKIGIGRLRKDLNCEYSLTFFVTSDNLIRGAAYNSLSIFYKLVEFKII
ncbi:MAG: aspartate-semialdehyde dehydrogenase [Bacilli bacterium]